MSHSAVNDKNQVVLGKIGKSHGIKGWVKLHSYTTPPENILEYLELQIAPAGSQRTLSITDSKMQNNNLLVHFDGVDQPEDAQQLTGEEVWVAETELPDLEEGEYYWHELEGMLVVNQQDLLLGEVSRLMETGANDVLVVSPTDASTDNRERLIPYLKEQVVKEVNKEANRILVDWDASFLD